MENVAIDVVNVQRRFNSFYAVKDFNLKVKSGEFISFLGPSGCGKTTTLRMIAGLDRPTGGDIFAKGRRINDIPVHQRNFGMVFQNLALFPHKTAFENIAFGLQFRKIEKHEVERRVRAALDMVRLPHVEDRMPSQLSGGQQQRIAVARAIVIQPDLLLFDEPFSALDAGLREEMRIELKRIQRALGITTIFVTHDQAEALTMADRVVVMHDGLIVQEGSPEDVYSRPQSSFVARFFGQVNEYDGTFRKNGKASRMELAEGVTVGIDPSVGVTSDAKLLLRSERIRVAKSFPAEAGVTVLEGVVDRFDFLGMLIRYELTVGNLPMTVLQPLEGGILQEGTAVSVRIPDNAWIMHK